MTKETPPTVGASRLSEGLDDEQFKEAFAMIAAIDDKRAFKLLTGMFVGFLEYLAVENGCDKNKEIKIEGNGSRDITIHAVSPNVKLRGAPFSGDWRSHRSRKNTNLQNRHEKARPA
jgi:hypothetical protein